MNPPDLARLILLAALWGASFMLFRLLAPAVATFVTADVRLLLGALTLIVTLRLSGKPLRFAESWRMFTAVGMVNSGLPFALFAAAALTVPATYLSVLNAMAPLFGAIFMRVLAGETLSARKAIGIALGIAGVALLSRLGPVPITWGVAGGVLAALAATACYGWAGVLIPRHAKGIEPMRAAAGTQLGAGLALAPIALAQGLFAPPPPEPVSLTIILALAAIGILCSGLAYVLYFQLINNQGATRALTVTFIIPIFGMLWAAVVLGEPITGSMIAGAGLVILGTAFVLR